MQKENENGLSYFIIEHKVKKAMYWAGTAYAGKLISIMMKNRMTITNKSVDSIMFSLTIL